MIFTRALPVEMFIRVTAAFEQYARLLDDDRLEEWVDLFLEDARYEIISRENYVRKLPLSLMLCDNKDMMRDRISALREANIYNIHWDCHLLGPISGVWESGQLAARCAYALYQTTQEGETRLFSVGRYDARLVEQNGQLRFQTMQVVVDTGAILTLLATPI